MTERAFIGEKGKQTLFILRVVSKVEVKDDRKTSYVAFLEDDGGNQAVWKPNPCKTWDELVPGKTYRLRATVTQHIDLEQMKQTVLSRCSILPRAL